MAAMQFETRRQAWDEPVTSLLVGDSVGDPRILVSPTGQGCSVST